MARRGKREDRRSNPPSSGGLPTGGGSYTYRPRRGWSSPGNVAGHRKRNAPAYEVRPSNPNPAPIPGAGGGPERTFPGPGSIIEHPKRNPEHPQRTDQPATTPEEPPRRGIPGPGQVIDHPKRDPDKDLVPTPNDSTPQGPDGPVNPHPGSDEADKQKREWDNAFEYLKRQFLDFGITDETFFQFIYDMIIKGYDNNTISLLLQDQPAYKKRFAGNEARRKNGLGVLRPAEYLELERSYEQIMRAAGLPPGFYDDPSDFANFIGLDISPNEINDRVQKANRYVNDSNPEGRAALAAYYPELTNGDLIANFLDPNRAMPLLEKRVKAAEIGGASRRHGLRLTGRRDAEMYADLGVTREQAEQGYSEIAGFLPETEVFGRRFGEAYSQKDAEKEVLGGLASSRRKRERLYKSETALFQGSDAVRSGSLGRGTGGSY